MKIFENRTGVRNRTICSIEVNYFVTKPKPCWSEIRVRWNRVRRGVAVPNCRKVWSNLSHISSVFCTIFCKRVHFATSATITVNEFAKNSSKNTRNVTKIVLQIFLQFCNVTVSCVGYWPTQMRTLSIICLHFFDIFSPLCVKKKSVN